MHNKGRTHARANPSKRSAKCFTTTFGSEWLRILLSGGFESVSCRSKNTGIVLGFLSAYAASVLVNHRFQDVVSIPSSGRKGHLNPDPRRCWTIKKRRRVNTQKSQHNNSTNRSQVYSSPGFPHYSRPNSFRPTHTQPKMRTEEDSFSATTLDLY